MTQKLFLAAFELVLVKLNRFANLRLYFWESVQRFAQVFFRNYSKCGVVPRDYSCSSRWVRQNRDFSKVLALVQRAHENLFLLLVADVNIAIAPCNYVEIGSRLSLRDCRYFGLLHYHIDVVDQDLLECRLVLKHGILFDCSWKNEVNDLILKRSRNVIEKSVEFVLLLKSQLDVAKIGYDSTLNIWRHLFDFHRRVRRIDNCLELLRFFVHVKNEKSHITEYSCINHRS